MKTRMPSKNLGVDVKSVCASVDAGKRKVVKAVAVKRRKYRSKSVLLDEFFCAQRNAEVCFHLVIGLDRCSSFAVESVVVPRSFVLFINAVPHRFPSIQGCTDFLNGFCSGLSASQGASSGRGDLVPERSTVEKMIGRKI